MKNKIESFGMTGSSVKKTYLSKLFRKNQDAYTIDTHNNIYAVADGLGGEVEGDKASQLVISLIQQEFRNTNILNYDKAEAIVKQIREKFVEKNILGASTLSLLNIANTPKELFTSVLNVGDSRVYQFSNNTLKCLTLDYGSRFYPKYDQFFRYQNRISQVNSPNDYFTLTEREQSMFEDRTGVFEYFDCESAEVGFELIELYAKINDIFILSTDGNHDNSCHGELENILCENKEKTIQEIVSIMYEHAFNRSLDNEHIRATPDDITIIGVKICENERK